ncbi:ExbD/TolR family protein [Phycobium rhodophyticola]
MIFIPLTASTARVDRTDDQRGVPPVDFLSDDLATFPARAVQVEPPEAKQENAAEAAPVLYLSSEGEIAFENLRGTSAITLAASRLEKGAAPLQLRADQNTPATKVAAMLKELAAAGITEIALITRAP